MGKDRKAKEEAASVARRGSLPPKAGKRRVRKGTGHVTTPERRKRARWLRSLGFDKPFAPLFPWRVYARIFKDD